MKNTMNNLESNHNAAETTVNREAVADFNAKKAFVEPELSVPVDVLESTTFFQVIDSGATN